MSIFVDRQDIVKFTAPAKTKEERIQVLISKQVPFDINGAGDILVLRSTFEYLLGIKTTVKRQDTHNFGAMH